jgi:hypothetical protein
MARENATHDCGFEVETFRVLEGKEEGGDGCVKVAEADGS